MTEGLVVVFMFVVGGVLLSWLVVMLGQGTRERVELVPSGEYGESDFEDVLPSFGKRPRILLGHDASRMNQHAYDGEGHLLTIGFTRSGKGAGAIIPNLLQYSGSVIVVDPKGENTERTAEKRAAMGQNVVVVDPWNITGKANATYDPMSVSRSNSELAVEDARMIAEAMVVPTTALGQVFWEEEARSLIATLVLHVMLQEKTVYESGWRFIRDAVSDLGKLDGLLKGLSLSPLANGVISRGARQFLDKAPNEKSGVLSTVRQQTSFLDSVSIQSSLAAGSFKFDHIRDNPTSVYLVVPIWRLPTYGRWLRMVISMALAELTREENKAKHPVLCIIDEFPAIGQLQSFDTAFAMMAGYGVQLWPIIQDISQIQKLYGSGWQTFVANAAVLQSFGARDLQTATYLSERLGSTTIPLYERSASSGGERSVDTHSSRLAQRPLMYPHEIMRMNADTGLVFVEDAAPILFQKIRYFED